MTLSERRWLALSVVVILLVASAPALIGLARSTPQQPFTGAFILPADIASYYAKMRLGVGGVWLFQNVYAVEPHRPAPVYLFYLLLGKLAVFGGAERAPLGLLVLIYHLARIAAGGVLLVMLYRVIALLINAPAGRQLAWILTVLGGGFGWLMLLIYRDPLPLGAPPLDLYLAEAVMTVPLLALPHTLAARAALIGGLLLLVRSIEADDWRPALGAGICWLAATAIVPFDILIAGAIVAGWIGVRWLRERAFPRRLAVMGMIAGIPGILFNLALLAAICGDPVYADWYAQNALPLPHPLHLISLYGLQSALAAVGAVAAFRQREPQPQAHVDLFVGWLVAGPLLWLVPVPFRLRLIEGWIVPLTALAAMGLFALTQHWRPALRRAAVAGVMIALLLSGAFLIAGSTAQSLYGIGVYLNPDQAALLEWLRVHAPPDARVLASTEIGEILPAAAPVRPLIGHEFETPDFARKEAEVQAFFGGGMNDEARRDLLDRYGIDYVWLGPDERPTPCEGGLCFNPEALGLRLVIRSGPYAVYGVADP